MDDDGEGKVDPLVTGVYRLDQLVRILYLSLVLPPLFEQMLANKNSRELSLQDGSDASEKHGKARIEVTTCDFEDRSELAGSGSDELTMKGSNESILLRKLSEESDHGTLPRHVSEL